MGRASVWHFVDQRIGTLAKDQVVVSPSEAVGQQLPRYEIYYHIVAMNGLEGECLQSRCAAGIQRVLLHVMGCGPIALRGIDSKLASRCQISYCFYHWLSGG